MEHSATEVQHRRCNIKGAIPTIGSAKSQETMQSPMQGIRIGRGTRFAALIATAHYQAHY